MKKNYTVLLIIFVLFVFRFNAQATMHMVNVQDFSFSPAIMDVNVGDTIMWMWVGGTHTTTSTSVPSGAATWNANINSTSSFFSYRVTVAGTYNYECSIHPTLMTGSFTATGTLGILSVNNSSLLLNSTLVSNQLQITYELENASPVDIQLFDMNGKQLNNFNTSILAPGIHTDTYSLRNLAKGEYILVLRTKDIIASRKIVVE